jgi:hypothetical protein
MTDEDKVIETLLALTFTPGQLSGCPVKTSLCNEPGGKFFPTRIRGGDYLFFQPCKRHLPDYFAEKRENWKAVTLEDL